MFNAFRKVMLMGLGAAAMSRDKIREIVDELVAKGEVSREEGKKLYEELMAKAEEEGRNLNERIRGQIRGALKDLGLAERSQVAALERRIAKIEKKLEALAPKPAGPD